MIQAEYCGYCRDCKPEYINFAKDCANSGLDVTVATIQIDDKKSNMSNIGSKINSSTGVPAFVAFKNGVKVGTHTGARNKQAFLKFYQDTI